MSIQYKEFEKLYQEMQKETKDLNKFNERFLTEIGQRLLAKVKKRTPVDTGMLRESIHMRIDESANEISGVVYTNNEYALYVEYGTGQVANGTYPDKTKVLTPSSNIDGGTF